MKLVLSVIVVSFVCTAVFGAAGPTILVSPSDPTISIGGTVTLRATRVVVTGHGKVVDSGRDKTITWSSSDPNVATVNADGTVTGVAAGTAVINAHIRQAPFDAATQVTVKATSFFVYAPNEVSSDVSGYSNLGGALASLPGFPLATGLNPITLAADPAGKFAYVADIATSLIYGFEINSGTGALSPVPGSPFAAGSEPFAELVDPSGTHLYVANIASNDISIFQIGADGSLAEIPGSPFAAGNSFIGDAIAMDQTGKFFYKANFSDSTVSAYTVDAGGSLSTIAGSPYSVAAAPASLAVDPLNRFVFVTSLGTEAISTFQMDSSTGALTPSSVLALAPNTGAFGIVVDPTGRFAYVANEGSSNVTGYSIHCSTGALHSLAGSPFAGVQFPLSITMDNTGSFVYLPNPTLNSISGFAVDSGTGALTPVPGSPFSAGNTPFSVTVVPRGQ